MRSRWILMPGVLMCIGVPAHSGTALLQNAGWAADGIPVCSTSSRQITPNLAAEGSGGAIIAWEDDRFGSPAIFAQRLTGTGTVAVGWPDSGLAAANTTTGYDPFIAGDGAGGAFLIWPAATLVVLKHLGSGGTVSSSAELSELATAPSRPGSFATTKLQQKYTPVVTPDGAGGAFVAWQSAKIVGGYIEIQRVTAAGMAAPGWPQPRIIDISYFYASQPLLCPDGAGGVLLSWLDDAAQLRILRMTASGVFVTGWDTLGVVVSPSPKAQGSPGMVPDGAGGALVFWSEARGGGGEQLFAQHVTGGGTIASGWPAAGCLVCGQNTVAGGVRNGRVGPVAYTVARSDGAGGAFVAWSDQRADAGDIYIQHVLDNGAIPSGWTSDGALVCAAAGLQGHPDLEVDGGGVLLVWEDQRGGGTTDLYGQRITMTGLPTPAWASNGIAVCSEPHDQLLPKIGSDGAFGAIVTWQDDRGPAPRVYAARIFGDGVVAVGGSPIPSTAALELTRIAPNPSAGELTIEFTLPDSDPARIEIVDLAGRLLESRDIASFGSGRHSLARFGERDLPTGLYFAVLRHGSSTRMRRFAIVR